MIVSQLAEGLLTCTFVTSSGRSSWAAMSSLGDGESCKSRPSQYETCAKSSTKSPCPMATVKATQGNSLQVTNSKTHPAAPDAAAMVAATAPLDLILALLLCSLPPLAAITVFPIR